MAKTITLKSHENRNFGHFLDNFGHFSKCTDRQFEVEGQSLNFLGRTRVQHVSSWLVHGLKKAGRWLFPRLEFYQLDNRKQSLISRFLPHNEGLIV